MRPSGKLISVSEAQSIPAGAGTAVGVWQWRWQRVILHPERLDFVHRLTKIGSASGGGQDVCNELKVFSSMTKTRRMGRGSAKRGGTEQDVGHNYAFGNTEGKARYDNLGCKPRGRRCDGYFNHKTENEARRVLVTVTIRSCVLAPKLRL